MPSFSCGYSKIASDFLNAEISSEMSSAALKNRYAFLPFNG